MGALKGKPHRKFTQAEKLAYISEFQDAHISQSKFAKEHGWMKAELILDFGISKVSNLKKTLDQYVLYFNSERFAAALNYKPPIQYRTELGF